MVRWLHLSRQLWIAMALTVLLAVLVAVCAAQTNLIAPRHIPLFVAAHVTGPFAAFVMDPTWAIASPFIYLICAAVLLPIVYFEFRPRRWLRAMALAAYVLWFIVGFGLTYSLTT
jgi:hypothetical protein